MATNNLGSRMTDGKAEQQIAAIDNLLANPAVHVSSRDLASLLASKPESRSDLLACLMALHAEMFDFTGYTLLQDLSPSAKTILGGMEQRWSRAIRNAIGCLSKEGATVPPTFGEFFSTQLIQ
jgi:hypothetical protein